MLSEGAGMDGIELGAEDLERFRRDGFVVVRGAFPPEVATRCAQEVQHILQSELGVDLAHPDRPRYSVSRRAGAVFDGMITPRVRAAFDALAGKGRWNDDHVRTHGNFFTTFPGLQGNSWHAPVGIGRWHIDFGHDARTVFELGDGNCAFVPAFLLTRSKPDAAPTVAVAGSHRMMARLLALFGRPMERFLLVAFCEGFVSRARPETIVQMTGEAGDAVIMHPLLIHSASANATDELRIMANTGVGLKGARRLRPEDGDQSLIEQSITAEVSGAGRRPVKRMLVGILLSINHRLWQLRYKVHGSLPRFTEISLPWWRYFPERILRASCAMLSGCAANLLSR